MGIEWPLAFFDSRSTHPTWVPRAKDQSPGRGLIEQLGVAVLGSHPVTLGLPVKHLLGVGAVEMVPQDCLLRLRSHCTLSRHPFRTPRFFPAEYARVCVHFPRDVDSAETPTQWMERKNLRCVQETSADLNTHLHGARWVLVSSQAIDLPGLANLRLVPGAPETLL